MSSVLTQKRAEERFSSFEKGIEYKLYFNLKKGKKFHGVGQYNFNLKNTKHVFFNFSGDMINSVSINSKNLSQSEIEKNWQNFVLEIPENFLKIGKNEILIQFSNTYNSDGNGLHSTIDTDGKQYIYSQSEPFFTNKVYPLFDQPDLKAKMTFFFNAPNDWSIVSNTDYKIKENSEKYIKNETEKKIEPEKKSETTFKNYIKKNYIPDFTKTSNFYHFLETPLLSTYLFAFVGGPYCWIPYTNFDGPYIPMNILCRKSYKKFAEAQKIDIFLYCKKSMEFYENFFQTKNPFKKYDLIFCPEFTCGAMEYPGVITFTDRKLYQQTPTPMEISWRGKTMAHELAHMWFGNFVTMKWWNDLWLNESFADFVCFLAMEHVNKQELPFETVDVWTNMLIRKGWGYTEDQLDTTHPISCDVVNTGVAESIFDGITYSKGAAVVKQIYFLIGKQRFSDNLKSYFDKYGWGNATLENFLEEISRNDGESEEKKHKAYDLKFFNQEWIEKAGLNQIEAKWDPSVQGKQQIQFIQTPALLEHPTLRYHKLKLAALNEKCEIVHVQEFILENKKITTLDFDNKNYKALITNYEDWGYIKMILDKHSLKFLEKNLSKINCNLTSLLVIRSFFDMVRDGIYKGTEFIDSFINSGFLESLINNIQILDITFQFLRNAINLIPKTFRKEYRNKIFLISEKMLSKTKNGHILTILKSSLISNGVSLENIDRLKMIFDETHPTLNLKLGKVDNWKIIYKINCSSKYSKKVKEIYTQFMLKNDSSDIGKKYLLAIDALSEDSEVLEKLWKSYTDKNFREFSYEEMSYSLLGFTSSYRNSYSRHVFLKRFFDVLPDYFKNESRQYGLEFFYSGFRNWDNCQFLIDNLKKVLLDLTDSEKYFISKINKKISFLKRFMKCCKLYEN